MSLVDLSRWQFAITVMFRMTFPAITVAVMFVLVRGKDRAGAALGNPAL